MSTISDLSLAVKTRIGTQRLVELTQEDGSSTIIDDDVLNAACQDAIGEFERITGITADSSNISHVSILVQGVFFYLEDYKARDGGIMTSHGKRFYASCESLREKVYFSPSGNSVLSISQERSNSRPDFDRSNSAWKFGKITTKVAEISEE